MANDAPHSEILAGLSGQAREALPTALRSALAERAPAPDLQVMAEIARLVGLIGQGWTGDGRKEFIELAREEMRDMPAALALEALTLARRRVNDGRHLMTFVFDHAAKRTQRLDAEIKRLEFLSDLVANEG